MKIKSFKKYPMEFIVSLHNRLMATGKRFGVYSQSKNLHGYIVRWEL